MQLNLVASANQVCGSLSLTAQRIYIFVDFQVNLKTVQQMSPKITQKVTERERENCKRLLI